MPSTTFPRCGLDIRAGDVFLDRMQDAKDTCRLEFASRALTPIAHEDARLLAVSDQKAAATASTNIDKAAAVVIGAFKVKPGDEAVRLSHSLVLLGIHPYQRFRRGFQRLFGMQGLGNL